MFETLAFCSRGLGETLQGAALGLGAALHTLVGLEVGGGPQFLLHEALLLRQQSSLSRAKPVEAGANRCLP